MRLEVGAALRRALRYRGMLVLVLWQAPIQPVVRPNGSIGLMIGGGTDEHAELSCDGDLIQADRVPHRVVAVQADYSVNETARIDAVVGRMSSDWGSHDGAFVTAQVRMDWRVIGLGGGIAVSPAFEEDSSTSSTAWPSVYLRVGSSSAWHLRVDAFPPTAFAAQQIARVGLGFNAVQRDEPAFFVGLAGVGSNEAATGIAADVSVPVANRFALQAQGYYGYGKEYNVNGIAIGGRYLFGAMPVPLAAGGRVP
jgi:hypothetical protein